MSVWEKQYDFYKSLPNYYNTLLDTVAIYDCLNEALDRISYYYLYHFPDDSKRAFIDELRNTLYDDYQRFIIEFHSDEEANSKPIEFRDKEAECKLFNSLADSAKEIKSYINKEIEIAPEPYRAWFKALKSICNHIVRLKNNIHHCICKEMFASVFHGETVYVYIDNYDVIPADKEHYMSAFMNATPEAGEPVEYLHCSVVSKKMLDYDRTMFNLLLENDNDKEKINYRPYFMEFIIPVDKYGKAKGQCLDKDELLNINSEDGWFEAKFIANSENKGSNNYSYVEGGMLTFASPDDYISGKLVFPKPELKRTSKELKKDIEGVYSKIQERKTDEINELLADHIPGIELADVYNIGHGNFITLNDANDNTKVIYDIGLPYAFPVSKSSSKMKQDYKDTYEVMKKIKTEIVIISHWDSDHYIGAYENEKGIFDIPWIVTKCNPKGQINAKRIMAYLYCKKNKKYKNNLYLYKGTQADTQVAFAEFDDKKALKFQLYKGFGTSSPITKINCQGIAVRVVNNNSATLMCGDIPYNCLSDSIINNNEYEYVVIPHHASNMSDKSYNALNSIKKIKYPIICVNGTEELGKSGVSVEKGSHCSNIGSKSNQILYFTDDDTHAKVNAYICDLTGNNPIDQK